MILDKLPTSHYSVEDVIKLLKKHTAKKPTVDLQFLVDNLDYMQVAKNFTIKIMKQNQETKEWYSDSHIVAVVATPREYEMLKWGIKQAYKRVTGKIVEPEKEVTAVTTSVDDLAGSTSQIRIDKKNKKKYGDKIVSGETTNEITEKA